MRIGDLIKEFEFKEKAQLDVHLNSIKIYSIINNSIKYKGRYLKKIETNSLEVSSKCREIAQYLRNNFDLDTNIKPESILEDFYIAKTIAEIKHYEDIVKGTVKEHPFLTNLFLQITKQKWN